MKKMHYLLGFLVATGCGATVYSMGSQELVESITTRTKALRVLGLSANAKDAQIKEAYNKLVLQWHPDKNPGREAQVTPRFLEIQAAYDFLMGKEVESEEESQEEPEEEPERGRETEEEKLNRNYSEMLEQLGESLSGTAEEKTLSSFVKNIGAVISTTLCKDRAFTIMPNIDEEGNQAPGFILLTNKR